MIVDVGDNVLARVDVNKAWNLGSVTEVHPDTDEVSIRWISDDRITTLPSNSDHIDILGKRKRKPRVNLIELEYEMRQAISNKQPRTPKSIKKEPPAPAKETTKAKSKKSANLITLEDVERSSDRSLACYISTLAPFISPKTHARLSAARPHPLKPTPTLPQPASIVNVTMRDYQREGLSWMAQHYLHKINCILADEMGLGKPHNTSVALY